MGVFDWLEAPLSATVNFAMLAFQGAVQVRDIWEAKDHGPDGKCVYVYGGFALAPWAGGKTTSTNNLNPTIFLCSREG